MNVYRMSWSWYEDHQYHLFSHPKSSKVKFEKDVISLLRKYGDEYIDQVDGWVGASDWISYVADKLPELGYKPVTIIGWNFFGGYILGGGMGASRTHDEEGAAWKKIIGPKLMAKALAKNKNIQLNMRRRLARMEKRNNKIASEKAKHEQVLASKV